MADFEVDRTSPAYLLGVAEYERDKSKAERDALATALRRIANGEYDYLKDAMNAAGDALSRAGGSQKPQETEHE